MVRLIRRFADVFSLYLRWHARLRSRNPHAPRRPAPTPARAQVIDFERARRVRCLSEPCANTRLAIALLRAQRHVDAQRRRIGTPR